MFKNIFAAFCAPGLALASDDLSKQCSGLVTTSGSIFNIQGLESATDYVHKVNNDSTKILHWNYCTYTSDSASLEETYAYLEQTDVSNVNHSELQIATETIPRTGSTNLRGEDGRISGISFTQHTDTPCVGQEDRTYSLTTNLKCDETIT